MSRTVSVKPMAMLTEQCSQCGVWFEFLHLGADGRLLCRTCLTLPDVPHAGGAGPGKAGSAARAGMDRRGPGRGSDTSGPPALGDPMSEIDPRRRGSTA
jgi:hypothetical protein